MDEAEVAALAGVAGAGDAHLNGGAEILYYELVMEDDGVGLPEGTDLSSYTSPGLKIVTTLTRQLHGEVRMTSAVGARSPWPSARRADSAVRGP